MSNGILQGEMFRDILSEVDRDSLIVLFKEFLLKGHSVHILGVWLIIVGFFLFQVVLEALLIFGVVEHGLNNFDHLDLGF